MGSGRPDLPGRQGESGRVRGPLDLLGDHWPEADERLEMLEEAIHVIRTLWQGGAHDHRGRHYRVEHARVYDLPDTPPEIVVSGFGPKAIDLAARAGDGYCTVAPDAQDAFFEAYRMHVLPQLR